VQKAVCHLNSQYNGSNQHDSQEFLSFLLDGIHEDLNRLLAKPTFTRTPEQEAELERMGPQIASEQEWRLWKTRNDSVIVDFFQGQFRNRLQCLTCQTVSRSCFRSALRLGSDAMVCVKTSTTYNVFSILQLPIPPGRSSKVPLQNCMDAFFNTEILDKDDAWFVFLYTFIPPYSNPRESGTAQSARPNGERQSICHSRASRPSSSFTSSASRSTAASRTRSTLL
jgi:ubiquitin carboxyl-terminal hydrolase 8